MTRTRPTKSQLPKRPRRWALQDAKARFSEVVRKAKTEGPQRITIRGREEVVILSVEDYRRVTGQQTGQALVEMMRESPLRDVILDHEPTFAPVRDIEL